MVEAGKLCKKIAVVTGGARGIGAAIAKRLAASGATVVVNYARHKAGADKTVAEIEGAGGVGWAIQGDFSKPEQIKRAFEDIQRKHGKLDVLVNNAGVFGRTSLEEITPEEFYRLFDLNVLGLLLVTKAAVALIGPDGGSVINIGALAGQMPEAGTSIYSATKGALNSITLSLSKELGPRNIRVNALNPGMMKVQGIDTDAGSTGNLLQDQVISMTPLGRLGQPDDIAKVAAFLASDDAYWVSGQVINLSGGLTY
jgi:3-oxoacyl-[acyl-carrier protein] reductase